MKLVSNVVIALVLAGASWGFLTWAADGRQPFTEGWWPALQANVEGLVNYSEDTVKDKLPDPDTLPQPDLGDPPSLEERSQDLPSIPDPSDQPGALEPGAGGLPAIPAP